MAVLTHCMCANQNGRSTQNIGMNCQKQDGYLVVDVFPEVQSDELEGVEHRPTEVIEVCVAKVWVVAEVRKTSVILGAVSGRKTNHQKH